MYSVDSVGLRMGVLWVPAFLSGSHRLTHSVQCIPSANHQFDEWVQSVYRPVIREMPSRIPRSIGQNPGARNRHGFRAVHYAKL